jgi:hypothetical protein
MGASNWYRIGHTYDAEVIPCAQHSSPAALVCLLLLSLCCTGGAMLTSTTTGTTHQADPQADPAGASLLLGWEGS